jgi:hypothetical protein
MLQDVIVVLIVLAATGYSAWKLAPAALRNALAERSGALARAGGASDKLARRIEIRAVEAAAKAGGCGSCGPCKGCAIGQQQAEGEERAD